MDYDQARIALNICEEMNRLYDLLWSIYENQFLELLMEKDEKPPLEDPLEIPF